jgi:hypothetical protein
VCTLCRLTLRCGPCPFLSGSYNKYSLLDDALLLLCPIETVAEARRRKRGICTVNGVGGFNTLSSISLSSFSLFTSYFCLAKCQLQQRLFAIVRNFVDKRATTGAKFTVVGSFYFKHVRNIRIECSRYNSTVNVNNECRQRTWRDSS